MVAGAEAATSRDEAPAQEATPEALAAGKEILERLVELMGYEATVDAVDGPTAKITVFGADDEEKEARPADAVAENAGEGES